MFEQLSVVSSVLGEKALNALSYADTRFTSSSYKAFQRLVQNFEVFATTIEEFGGGDIESEKSFQIRGQDFAFDLCLVVDALRPIVTMMLRLQDLQLPCWKIVRWIPRVVLQLKEMRDSLC